MAKSHIIKTLLTAVFVSIELAMLLFAIIIAWIFPQLVIKIGNLFAQQNWGLYSSLVGLPIGGLLYAANTLQSLLHPSNAEQKGFYKWPDYPLLRCYSYIPIIFCLVGTIIAIIFLLTPTLFSYLIMGTIYLAITLAWLVSVITLKMAQLRIDALLGGGE